MARFLFFILKLIFVILVLHICYLAAGSAFSKVWARDHINEIMQDNVEQVYGIKKFWEWSTSKQENPISAQTNLSTLYAGRNVFPDHSEGRIEGSPRGGCVRWGEVVPAVVTGNSVKWNRQIIFQGKSDFAGVAFDQYFVFFLCGSIAFAGVLLLVYSRRSAWNAGDEIYRKIKRFSLIVSLIMLAFLFLVSIHYNSYENDYDDALQRLKLHREKINALLSTGKETRIVELPFLSSRPNERRLNADEIGVLNLYPARRHINDLHQGRAFLGATDIFAKEFLRVNVNMYTYLFCGLSCDELRRMNPMMTYRDQGNGIVVGKYQTFIQSSIRLYWRWLICCIVWTLICLFSVGTNRKTSAVCLEK